MSALCVAFLARSGPAAAVQPALALAGSRRCSIAPEALAARVGEAVVGEANAELRVEVALADGARATSASVRLLRGEREIGRRRVVGGSCAEALDAVVAIVALALSSTHDASSEGEGEAESEGEPERHTAAPHTAAPRSARSHSIGLYETGPDATQPSAAVARAATTGAREPVGTLATSGLSARQWPVLTIMTAADVGRLGVTARVGIGGALPVQRGEWRARLWYGLPSFEAEEEGAPLRSVETRTELWSAGADHCWRLDAAGWLGLCGGLELGTLRERRRDGSPGAARTERERFAPFLDAALGSTFTYRGGRWEPGLEVTARLPVLGAAPAWGGAAGGSPVAFRVAAGVSHAF